MKAAQLQKTTDPEFVPTLNEKLMELERRLDRQVEKRQRIEGIKITTVASVGDREVKHNLGMVPNLVVIEVIDSGTVVFHKPHTSTSIFLRAFGGSPVIVNVVVRG